MHDKCHYKVRLLTLPVLKFGIVFYYKGNGLFIDSDVYSHKDPSPELVLVMRRNLTTWGFDEKACINWRSSENSRCKTWNWRLPPVLKITMTLKISSQDINQTLGEMKERTKYYTNLPTKCVLGNNFFQEIFNSLKNLYIFPETYKWIWAGV